MPLLSTHIFKKFCSFLIFLIYLHRCVEISVFLPVLQQKNPLSRCATAPPRGAPFGAAANFPMMPNTLATSLRPWLSLRGKTSPAPGEDVAQRQKGESGAGAPERVSRPLGKGGLTRSGKTEGVPTQKAPLPCAESGAFSTFFCPVVENPVQF